MKLFLPGIVCFFFISGISSVSGSSFFHTNNIFFNDSASQGKLPVIRIDTRRHRIHDNKRIHAAMKIDSIQQTDGGWIFYSGKITIETRGSSSRRVPKKSYSFSTKNAENEPLPVSLLGLPVETDWILYAPYSDKTMLRDVIAYKISRDLGYYATQTIFVELYLNKHYEGIYILEEKIKQSKVRVNPGLFIENNNNRSTLTGGYILRIDRPGDAKRFLKPGKLSRYVSNQSSLNKNGKKKSIVGTHQPVKCDNKKNYVESSYKPNGASWQTVDFHFYDPPAESLSVQQRTGICNFMYAMESSLVDPFPASNDSGYHRLLEIRSFIDYFILNEVSRNIDSYRLSTYFSIVPYGISKRMIMGPVWDFNLSMGNAEYCDGYLTSGWAYEYNYTCGKDPWLVPFWWERLIEDPFYRTELKCRWLDLRKNVLSTENMMSFIDEEVNYLGDAVNRNYKRWPILKKDVWPNKYVYKSYPEEITYLKQWLTERLEWLDRNMPGDCTGISYR